jgi:hypothetical protein
MRRSNLTIAVAFAPLLLGCDDPPRAVRPVDASVPAPASAPTREGCVRAGTLDAIESDPACIVKSVNEDLTRAAMKNLAMTVTAQPSEVVSGSTALLEITLRNTSSSEITVYLEARGRPPGPRTDWSRVAGVPEPPPTAPDVPRLFFSVATTDGRDHDVDAVPTVAGTGVFASPTYLGIHLRPGAKLVRAVSWWALSIPAPAPIVKDDAGHRYVPKTTAYPLYPGDYTIVVDVPLAALSREERKITTRVHVIRPPLLDGGTRRGF